MFCIISNLAKLSSWMTTMKMRRRKKRKPKLVVSK
jgi:hypothetical protein